MSLSEPIHVDPLAPTATDAVRIASVLLAASEAAARTLPDGLHHACVLDLLLRLFLADEVARPIPVDELSSRTCSPEASRRWIAALASVGYVSRRGPFVALSPQGHRGVTA